MTENRHHLVYAHPLSTRPSAGCPRGNDGQQPDPLSPLYPFRIVGTDLEPCQSFHDLQQRLLPLLEFVGPRIHHDMYLVMKLCRLAQASGQPDSAVWLQVLQAYVLPTLSLSKFEVALSHEVWSWIKPFPYQKRYTIYGHWQNRLYDAIPEMVIARAKNVKETKKIMRRISKDNVKQFGRALGKLSHGNPTVCFSTVLDQLQSYENLITPVVDCFRYISDLSFDVLSFVLMEDLANPAKSRLKPDGTNLSLWLNCRFFLVVVVVVGVWVGVFFDHSVDRSCRVRGESVPPTPGIGVDGTTALRALPGQGWEPVRSGRHEGARHQNVGRRAAARGCLRAATRSHGGR